MAMRWTNPSVKELRSDGDPVEAIQEAARKEVLNAAEKGWAGPPFDPFELAAIMRIKVVPSQTVEDATLTPVGRRYRLDFNPNRPRRRIRFSIAHELAHTLFPDCRERVRNRLRQSELRRDDWQLEMLCNIAASEFLMPGGNLPIDSAKILSIDDVIELQDTFDVSLEAILLRVVRLERRDCVIFVASERRRKYRLDYAVESLGAGFGFRSGLILPERTRVADCQEVGYTAKGEETWAKKASIHMECAGIPSYPGQRKPRVAGLAYRAEDTGRHSSRITFVRGDATRPHGDGPTIIAHVVNDAATRWGGRGFAFAMRKKWPDVQKHFRDWAESHRRNFKLGQVHVCRIDDDISVFSMIAQHGYGRSRAPRIRYHSLRGCLSQLREFAEQQKATVHMPKIGCGEAGGNWSIVQDLILECLSDHGVDVTVYEFGQEKKTETQPRQLSLFATY